jgi:hypothetical protein
LWHRFLILVQYDPDCSSAIKPMIAAIKITSPAIFHGE